MTEDEKQVLRYFLTMFTLKAILLIGINRLAKAVWATSDKFDPDFPHVTQFTVRTGTDVIGPHMPINLKTPL